MNTIVKLLLTTLFLIVACMVGANGYEYFAFGGLKGSFSSIALVALAHVGFIAAMVAFIVLIWRKQ